MSARAKWGCCSLMVLVVVMTGSIAMAGKPAGPTISRTDGCTILSTKQVEVFGAPVVEDPAHAPGLFDCNYHVGADSKIAPGGVFSSLVEYPIYGFAIKNALVAVGDKRALDNLSDYDLSDADGIGKTAYFNNTLGSLTVAADKKFAFTLTWREGGVDTELTKPTKKKLVKLAKNVVSRSPR
jgi:hypothetical protein